MYHGIQHIGVRGVKNGKQIYNDLDYLAGSWSSAEEKVFQENTQFFEEIDKELW